MRDLVDRFEPLRDEQGDWDSVVRDARRRPVLLGSAAGVAVGAAALFALVLFQPWATDNRTFLERALAAVDDGPVIHAVLRGDWGGENVDLATGKRTAVHGENEIWYDPARRVIRQVSRLGDTVLHDTLYEEDRASSELVALGRDYRAALESGSARTAGQDVIDGEPVTWVVVEAQVLPHGDGRLREWTVQVAVSNETFKPVATQDFVDGGKAGKGSLQRVISVESLPADEVDLEVPKQRVDENGFQSGYEPTEVDRASEILGRPAVWLGRKHAGLPLAEVRETYVRRGRARARALTGREAEEALRCRDEFRLRLERRSDRCRELVGRLGGMGIRGKTVYVTGPFEFGQKELGVSFFYGSLGDEPSTYRKETAPLKTEPFVEVTESATKPAMVVGGSYFPPEGSVYVGAGSRGGTARFDGLYVVLQASSPELILSAARALKPMD